MCFLLPQKLVKKYQLETICKYTEAPRLFSVSLDPWEEQLSLDNLVETLDDLYVRVSTVCVYMCVMGVYVCL